MRLKLIFLLMLVAAFLFSTCSNQKAISNQKLANFTSKYDSLPEVKLPIDDSTIFGMEAQTFSEDFNKEILKLLFPEDSTPESYYTLMNVLKLKNVGGICPLLINIGLENGESNIYLATFTSEGELHDNLLLHYFTEVGGGADGLRGSFSINKDIVIHSTELYSDFKICDKSYAIAASGKIEEVSKEGLHGIEYTLLEEYSIFNVNEYVWQKGNDGKLEKRILQRHCYFEEGEENKINEFPLYTGELYKTLLAGGKQGESFPHVEQKYENKKADGTVTGVWKIYSELKDGENIKNKYEIIAFTARNNELLHTERSEAACDYFWIAKGKNGNISLEGDTYTLSLRFETDKILIDSLAIRKFSLSDTNNALVSEFCAGPEKLNDLQLEKLNAKTIDSYISKVQPLPLAEVQRRYETKMKEWINTQETASCPIQYRLDSNINPQHFLPEALTPYFSTSYGMGNESNTFKVIRLACKEQSKLLLLVSTIIESEENISVKNYIYVTNNEFKILDCILIPEEAGEPETGFRRMIISVPANNRILFTLVNGVSDDIESEKMAVIGEDGKITWLR